MSELKESGEKEKDDSDGFTKRRRLGQMNRNKEKEKQYDGDDEIDERRHFGVIPTVRRTTGTVVAFVLIQLRRRAPSQMKDDLARSPIRRRPSTTAKRRHDGNNEDDNAKNRVHAEEDGTGLKTVLKEMFQSAVEGAVAFDERDDGNDDKNDAASRLLNDDDEATKFRVRVEKLVDFGDGSQSNVGEARSEMGKFDRRLRVHQPAVFHRVVDGGKENAHDRYGDEEKGETGAGGCDCGFDVSVASVQRQDGVVYHLNEDVCDEYENEGADFGYPKAEAKSKDAVVQVEESSEERFQVGNADARRQRCRFTSVSLL